MPLLEPVILSVSDSISARTSSKSTNFFPLQCRNSAYSTHRDRATFTRGEKGRQVTKGMKRKGNEREIIKLKRWKQQIEDTVRSLRHCDREAICGAGTKGDWDVAVCTGRAHSPALLLISCKMRGLRVTMPDPRGRKSLRGRDRASERKINTGYVVNVTKKKNTQSKTERKSCLNYLLDSVSISSQCRLWQIDGHGIISHLQLLSRPIKSES